MKPGNSLIGLSNSTPRAESTNGASNDSTRSQKPMIRTNSKSTDSYEMQNEHDIDEYLDHDDDFKYGFTYYLKTCLHLDRPTVKPQDEEKNKEKTKKTTAKEETINYINKSKRHIKYPEDSLYIYITNLLERPKEPFDMDFIVDLLQHDAEINYQNKYGDTCLIEICKFSNDPDQVVNLFDFFVRNGAKIELVNLYGHTVLHTVASKSNDNIELVRYICESHPREMWTKATTYGEEQTVLHYAARSGNVKIARYLILEKQVDKEARDHLGRTPLYCAAEYGQTIVVKVLKELECRVTVSNIYGQKALFWIVSKCPEIASDILDDFTEINRYSRKQVFHLRHVELEPLSNKTGELKIPDSKSVLTYIVETRNLELILHPVIAKLIQVKWNDFGRINAYIDLGFTVAYILAWNLIASLIRYEYSFKYDLPGDWWRIFLFAIGVFGILVITILEIKEFFVIIRSQTNTALQRLKELNEDRRYCHPLDKEQKDFLEEERKACSKNQMVKVYLADLWNIYDGLSVVLLMIVVFTHVGDVVYPLDATTRAYARVFSVTVIIISLRLFETGRVIYEKFGMLVVILSFIVSKIIVWFLIYCIFWLSFASAFWMLFGYRQFADGTNAELCKDVDSPTNDANNCTVITTDGFGSYNLVAFRLWLITFGRQFDRASMSQIDPIMVDPLIGLFIGICTLMLVNIFIAILSSTFDRVYSSARGFFLLLRAQRVLNNEHASKTKRLRHLMRLARRSYEVYATSSVIRESKEDYIEQLNKAISKDRDELAKINQKYEDHREKMKDLYGRLNAAGGSSNRSNLKQRSSPSPVYTGPSKEEVEKLRRDLRKLKSAIAKTINEF